MFRTLGPLAVCAGILLLLGGVPAIETLRATLFAPPENEIIILNDNGGWSWFSDERAIVDAGGQRLLFSSVAHANGAGGEERDGDVEVTSFSLKTGAKRRFTLHDRLGHDDHNAAALLQRPDGRIVAMFSAHFNDVFSRWRISKRADAMHWEDGQGIDNGVPTTYANLHALSSEENRDGIVYAFHRGADLDTHFLISHDGGSTWSRGGKLLGSPGRPYVKYATHGTSRIDIVATEGHPDEGMTGIYHGWITEGRLHRADGTIADADISDENPVLPSDLTAVFPANEDSSAWPMDIHLDQDGFPVILFSIREKDGMLSYNYARFDGREWRVHFLAPAGTALYEDEPSYTGLAALHPRDPSRVFLSANVHPATGVPLISSVDEKAHFEIFAGRTQDGGATWTWKPVTENSSADNIRPIVPVWHDPRTALLWLRGTYASYSDYSLSVVGIIFSADLP